MSDGLDLYYADWRRLRVGATGFAVEVGDHTVASIGGTTPVEVFAASELDVETDTMGLVVRVRDTEGQPARGVVVAVVDAAGIYSESTIGRAGRVLFSELATGSLKCAVGGGSSVAVSRDPVVEEVYRAGLDQKLGDIQETLPDLDDAFRAICSSWPLSDETVQTTTDIATDLVGSTAKGLTTAGDQIGLQEPEALRERLGPFYLMAERSGNEVVVRITCRESVPASRVIVMLSSGSFARVAEAKVDQDAAVIEARVPWAVDLDGPTTVRIAFDDA